MIYELIEATDTYPAILKRTDKDGQITWIPTDEANADYQAYLNPVEHLTEIVPGDE